MALSTNNENLASDGTTINLGPGFLHIKQYACDFDVLGIGSDMDGGLFVGPALDGSLGGMYSSPSPVLGCFR
jgi:hypothetical protein